MEKFAFYIISLLACVGLMSSCSADDDETDFSDGIELTIGGEEINSVAEIPDRYRIVHNEVCDTCVVKCFHSEEEARASRDLGTRSGDDAMGLEIPPIDWDSQTLVLAKYTDPCLIKYSSCKVIKKNDKYLVELSYTSWLGNAYGTVGVFIVVNKPGLTESEFSMKATCAGFMKEGVFP